MKRRTSADFKVGQVVRCADPEVFLQPLRNYLKDREGTVEKVLPVVRPDDYYCGHINKVVVKWGKRNGRGKERTEMMDPRDIQPSGEKP